MKTTDILQNDLGDDKAASLLYEKFIGNVQRAIDGMIKRYGLPAGVDAELVAETTLRQAIDQARKDARFRQSSDSFRALLFTIAKRRVLNHARKLGAADAETVDFNEVTDAAMTNARHSELDQLASKEVSELVVAEFLQETDPIRGLANLLCGPLEFNPDAAIRILQRLPNEVNVPSPPTIRRNLASALERVRTLLERLQDDSSVDDSGA